MPEVPYDLAALTTANLSLLCSWFKKITGNPPPTTSSTEFLRLYLAWHLHAAQDGKEPRSLRQRLLKKSKAHFVKTHTYSPGTRFIREWQGKTYEVTVLKEGYLWQGNTYRSLSQIATTITGARWSGPRFFGVKLGSVRP